MNDFAHAEPLIERALALLEQEYGLNTRQSRSPCRTLEALLVNRRTMHALSNSFGAPRGFERKHLGADTR